MFFKDLQALIEHQYRSINILFVIVSILSNFIIEICIGMLFFLCCTTLVSKLLDKLLLKLGCCFDIFS